MATTDTHARTAEEAPAGPEAAPTTTRRPRLGQVAQLVALSLGAVVFLFPFYYMVVGALQASPNPGPAGALPDPSNMTLYNFAQINGAISLGRTLLNSSIFTGGVILLTLLLGFLAGYALARLEFRGRGVIFTLLLLTLVLPFQLLMIPMYVLVVRYYGLADSYVGMIIPFAINGTAVFIFRQFFRSIPNDIYEAAEIDGASQLQILLRIAIPMARPAILTAIIVTFIGPWNEFLWPFLITKERTMQPLAVALANFINTLQATIANPFGAILAGATVLSVPAVVLFLAFQRHFVQTNLGSGIKG